MDVSHQHHLYSGVFADSAPLRRELEGVLDALLAARVVLAETRGAHRVVLNLKQVEVERVLGEVDGQQWRNMLAAEMHLIGMLFYSPFLFSTVQLREQSYWEHVGPRIRTCCYAWNGTKEANCSWGAYLVLCKMHRLYLMMASRSLILILP
jgi:hypothetical protein